MLPEPWAVTAERMASTSVRSSSPTRTSSITIGVNPAVEILLKQDFWSILDQMTYLASGRFFSERQHAEGEGHPSSHWDQETVFDRGDPGQLDQVQKEEVSKFIHEAGPGSLGLNLAQVPRTTDTMAHLVVTAGNETRIHP